MKHFPWIIHAVKDHTLKRGMIDAHTHGLSNYGSLELQFVLDCDDGIIAYILNTVGKW